MSRLTPVLLISLAVVSAGCAEQGMTQPSPLASGAATATGARGGGAPSNTPVTTTIQGVAGGGFDIASDGGGNYSNSSTLVSVIDTVGAWVLDATVKNATRTVYLNFRDPDPGSNVPPPSGQYKARLISRCNDDNYNRNMSTMAVNETMRCPLHITFDSYRINMNPFHHTAIDDVDDVDITCLAVDAFSKCSSWTIRPTGDGGSNRAVLDKQGRGTTWVRQGIFRFSFAIDVSQP